MSRTASDMKAIAKGGGINTFSEVGKAGLTVIVLFILARSVSLAEFGMFTLAQSLSLLLMVVGSLGLGKALPRQIGYYQALKDDKRVNGVIRSGMWITCLAAGILSISYFLMSYPLAVYVFNDDSLMFVFQAFSLHLGASIINMQIGSVFRGLKDVRPKVYFFDLMPRALAVGAFAFLWSRGAPVEQFALAYALAFAIPTIFSILYLLSHRPTGEVREVIPMHKALLAFSLPLLGLELLQTSNPQISVLILGSMVDNTATVGTFTAAKWITAKLPIMYRGMMFIYVPILAGYMAKGDHTQMRRAFPLVTKWVTALTLPAIMIIFLFPVQLLNLLYGGYSESWFILVILASGHTVRTLVGPTGQTMLAMGRVRMMMFMAGISTATNIVLNVLLIPPFGAAGSAIATAGALTLYSVLTLTDVFRSAGIHAFNGNYIKLISLAPLACVGEYLLLRTLLGMNVLTMLIAAPVFLVTVPGIAIALGVITPEERRIITRKIRKVLRRK
jgi:O-antigen/teichoic acid export membrane protein